VIEGIGTSFMAVLAPAIIAQWFVAKQRGTQWYLGRVGACWHRRHAAGRARIGAGGRLALGVVLGAGYALA